MRAVGIHADVIVVTSRVWQTTATAIRAGDEAFLIDSPVYPDELDALAALLEQAEFDVRGLLATHGDWDHLLARLAFPGVALGCCESTAERLRGSPGEAQRELRAFDEELMIERERPLTLGSVQALPVPSTGGTVTTLASEHGGSSSGIAIDSTSVYWTYLSAAPSAVLAVMSTSLAGGAPVTLASGPAVASGPLEHPSVAVNSTGIYWGTPSILRGMLKSGGTPADLVVPWGPKEPGDLAVDETSVYWVNADESAVMKAPLTGGPPVTLAAGQSHPRAIAVDATSVYWATSSLVGPDDYGDVMRLTPK